MEVGFRYGRIKMSNNKKKNAGSKNAGKRDMDLQLFGEGMRKSGRSLQHSADARIKRGKPTGCPKER